MVSDEFKLKSWEKVLERIRAEDPQAHYRNEPGLICTPEQSKQYRIQAIEGLINSL